MIDRELMQQALDALEEAQSYTSSETWSPSMTEECAAVAHKLRSRLAHPEVEPASWGVQEGENLYDVFFFKDEADEMCRLKGLHARDIPLYTTPPQRDEAPAKEWIERERAVGYREGHQAALKQRKWQGLTEEEMTYLFRLCLGKTFDVFARAIEAKLKEKNT